MSRPILFTDPLWQCLCPRWKAAPVPRWIAHSRLSSRARCIRQNAPRRLLHQDTRPSRITSAHVQLENLPTESVYVYLNTLAREGKLNACQRAATHLLQEREEPLSTSLYNALILSNVDAATGGAWRVKELLEEMEIERYIPDAVTCHNILKVLAVHPDHVLRTDVLARMRQHWFELTAEGHHDVTAGWLREGCIELALNQLEIMQTSNIDLEPWLLDMFVYSLCAAGEVEAAYDIMRKRYEAGELNMSRAVWHYYLDAASNARHLSATELAWMARVRLGQLHASAGIVDNVLATAARHGSPSLATEAIAHLTKRGDEATHVHYQHLVDSYLNHRSPDISKALSILSIMAVEKKEPTKWQTRSLYQHIRSSKKRTAQALEALQQLHAKGRLVPLAAANMLLECYAYQVDKEGAINLYKQMADLLANGPDLETYRAVLTVCSAADIELVDALFDEMLQGQVRPDEQIYNRVVCLNAEVALTAAVVARDAGNDVQSACIVRANKAQAYYDNMINLSLTANATTLEALAVALSAAGDSRCFEIVESAHAYSSDFTNRVGEHIRQWISRSQTPIPSNLSMDG